MLYVGQCVYAVHAENVIKSNFFISNPTLTCNWKMSVCQSLLQVYLYYLSDRTSTFLSLLMTEMSDNSAPQQFSFLTWFMSLTLVLATIMSSLNFTMMMMMMDQASVSNQTSTRQLKLLWNIFAMTRVITFQLWQTAKTKRNLVPKSLHNSGQ